MAGTSLVIPIVIGVIIIIIGATMAYFTLGYINASSCGNSDANAEKAKTYVEWYGISLTILLVLLILAGVLYYLYDRTIKGLGRIGGV